MSNVRVQCQIHRDDVIRYGPLQLRCSLGNNMILEDEHVSVLIDRALIAASKGLHRTDSMLMQSEVPCFGCSSTRRPRLEVDPSGSSVSYARILSSLVNIANQHGLTQLGHHR